ncbi:small leucine-rich protein 1-like [Engraulis encrasicolus]|uniref:small leucine-rich protein 1-like n=1 Tax=Engraulis encrasicolus TaxID=184585 RepID=UPI002FD5A70B
MDLMSASSSLFAFLRELPWWLLWGGVFLPVVLVLLLVIAHLEWKLQETEAALLAAPNPRETAQRLSLSYSGNRSLLSPRRQAGLRVHT